jgi:hypothetical protein
MDASKKKYFDELGASGEWKTEYFLQAEVAWQLKRIADQLVSGPTTIRQVGNF